MPVRPGTCDELGSSAAHPNGHLEGQGSVRARVRVRVRGETGEASSWGRRGEQHVHRKGRGRTIDG